MRCFISLLALCAAPALAQAPAPPNQQNDPQPLMGAATTALAPQAGAKSPEVPVKSLANSVRARTPEEQATQSGFQAAAALDHAIGLGTFVDARFFASLVATLQLQAQYSFELASKRMVASASIGASFEYTLPDVETGRRLTASNLRLSLVAPALLREPNSGIAVSPSVGLTLPTSLESWTAGLLTTASVGVGLSRGFLSNQLHLSASVGGSRGFFTSPVAGIRNPAFGRAADPSPERDGLGNLRFICREGQVFCAVTGMNTAWSISLGGAARWRASTSLEVVAGYTFTKSWGFPATQTVDEFTPKALDSNGNPVARVGLGQRDRTLAVIGLGYQINDHYALEGGLQTVQTPLSGTGQVRFPWFAFGHLADNATSAYLSLSGAY